MNVIKTKIPEVLIIEPTVFGDERGFFMESWNQHSFNEAVGQEVNFVQDNHSRSAKNVLRGLHYQIKQPQGKLVRCVAGEVFDVAVDIRKGSKTYGQWVGEIISAENKQQLWMPEPLPPVLIPPPQPKRIRHEPPTKLASHPALSAISTSIRNHGRESGSTANDWRARPRCLRYGFG